MVETINYFPSQIDHTRQLRNPIKDRWLEPSQGRQKGKAKDKPKDKQPARTKIKRERASPSHGRKEAISPMAPLIGLQIDPMGMLVFFIHSSYLGSCTPSLLGQWQYIHNGALANVVHNNRPISILWQYMPQQVQIGCTTLVTILVNFGALFW